MILIQLLKTRIQRNSTLRLASLVFAQRTGIYRFDRVILQIFFHHAPRPSFGMRKDYR